MPIRPVKPGTSADVSSFDALGGLDIPGGPGAAAAGLLPVLISIYKNKAAREAATKAFADSAEGFGSSTSIAMRWLASKYPRIAAHINMATPVAVPEGAIGVTYADPGKVVSPITVALRGDLTPANTAGTMIHEATHVAQALGNKDFHSMYQTAGRLLGYNANPYEIAANTAAARRVEGASNIVPATAHQHMAQILDELGPMDYVKRMMTGETSLATILKDKIALKEALAARRTVR